MLKESKNVPSTKLFEIQRNKSIKIVYDLLRGEGGFTAEKTKEILSNLTGLQSETIKQIRFSIVEQFEETT